MLDHKGLATSTNLIQSRLLEARAAQDVGETKKAIGLCREAQSIGCQALQSLFMPYREEIAHKTAEARKTEALLEMLRDKAEVRRFLEQEERILLEAGLLPGLVRAVIDRCIDFLERDPRDLGNPASILQAFSALEFRVCTTAREELDRATEQDGQFGWRIPGRAVFSALVGLTIVGTNWIALGPQDSFGQLSISYGATWFPVWPWSGG